MNLRDFDAWYRGFLSIDALATIDDSQNGIQVGRGDGPIRKVAFAVDACLESIRRAHDLGAQVLFVHHGLLWGRPERLIGPMLERVRFLVQHDMALCVCHLPLDVHPEYGNNAVLARMMGLENLEPFGMHKGVALGFRGRFPTPVSVDEAVRRVLLDGTAPRSLLAFGPAEVRTAAIVSGGAPFEVFQAAAAGIDLYVTGESSHSVYRFVEESRMHMISAGHYATEVWGVKAVAEKLSRETGVETVFIDLPTGL